jgi:hypothetical protein
VDEIVARLNALEGALCARLEKIETRLSAGAIGLLDSALSSYREQVLSDLAPGRAQSIQWLGRIQADKTLRFPHRKILECLLRRVDYATGAFEEMQTSALCKDARVGKGRIAGYLKHLVATGYVEERDDGYRKHYRMRFRSSPQGSYTRQ